MLSEQDRVARKIAKRLRGESTDLEDFISGMQAMTRAGVATSEQLYKSFALLGIEATSMIAQIKKMGVDVQDSEPL